MAKLTKLERKDAKRKFSSALQSFVKSLDGYISGEDGGWTIKGFIDIYRNIYTISSDTKIISKILEIHLFPKILEFAEKYRYSIVLAEHQNWYPDLSFISKNDKRIKFAVDLKTSYRDIDYPGHVNGFTLGSHGTYFKDRKSTKNIQFQYGEYSGHYCLGIIYTRADGKDINETEIVDVEELSEKEKTDSRNKRRKVVTVDKLRSITSVIKDFQFFVCEKWQLASDRQGAGNTANIGSITFIDDILKGNGIFSLLGEDWFDEYWMNYGLTMKKRGKAVSIRKLAQFLDFKKGNKDLIVPIITKKKEKRLAMTVIVPPIKSQGIKTKLVPWIQTLVPKTEGRWIEPFLGTGVVAFNSGFKKAILSDTNPHLINFYKSMQAGSITPLLVRAYLERESEKLRIAGNAGYDHFTFVKDRFNKNYNPLDFLFLSRAGFNGMMRFNKKGQWNIPFCKKPDRFSKAYITKIVNQVHDVSCLIQPTWKFINKGFEEIISEAKPSDIIYCDPPYSGRYVDYYNGWTDDDELRLYTLLKSTKAKFILSTWHHNDFRKNEMIGKYWNKFEIVTRDHFYHSGGKIENRKSIVEALVFNFDADIKKHNHGIAPKPEQLAILEEREKYIVKQISRTRE